MQSTREDLQTWIVEALESLGGRGMVVDVSRAIWREREHELRGSGDLLYSWQYDVRWAAQRLRDSGRLLKTAVQADRAWVLASTSPTHLTPREPPTQLAAKDAWSNHEIAVTVQSYFRMLAAEVRGVPYRKVDENRRVVAATGRSRGAVEFKYANVSAVLDEMGHSYVAGYKPRYNYQADLRFAVAKALRVEAMSASSERRDTDDTDAFVELDFNRNR